MVKSPLLPTVLIRNTLFGLHKWGYALPDIFGNELSFILAKSNLKCYFKSSFKILLCVCHATQPVLFPAIIHICNKPTWLIHNNIKSIFLCFELSSIRQHFPHGHCYMKLLQQVTCTYTEFLCSLFASCFFQIFKDFSWDWTCRLYNTHSSLNKAALDITQHTDTKCVTWLNSAGRAVLVVGPAACLTHQARKGGPAATRAQPRRVHVEAWKDIAKIVCSFLPWFISRDVSAQLTCTLALVVCKLVLNSAAWNTTVRDGGSYCMVWVCVSDSGS